MEALVFPTLWQEAVLIGIFILLNGFFAGAEIALISARRSRIQQLAAEGDGRAERVSLLQADPDRFLATVQIGVTFVGTFASAVGGAAAVRAISPLIRELPVPWLRAAAEPLALGAVVVVITYVMLILGELAPKSRAPSTVWRVSPPFLSGFSPPPIGSCCASWVRRGPGSGPSSPRRS
jgi:putative hemolysin